MHVCIYVNVILIYVLVRQAHFSIVLSLMSQCCKSLRKSVPTFFTNFARLLYPFRAWCPLKGHVYLDKPADMTF